MYDEVDHQRLEDEFEELDDAIEEICKWHQQILLILELMAED